MSLDASGIEYGEADYSLMLVEAASKQRAGRFGSEQTGGYFCPSQTQ